MFCLHLSRTDPVLPAIVPPKEPLTLGSEVGVVRLEIEEWEPRLVPVLLLYLIELEVPVGAVPGQ